MKSKKISWLYTPGVNICSSFLDNYECLSGTSMSTPHVAGGAALLLQKDSSLSPFQVKEILENGALDLGEKGKDINYGTGLVDLSNLEKVIVEESEKENYKLIIPIFEVDKENEIILIWNNTFDEKKKFKVVFNLEELDYDLKKEIKKSIKSGEAKEFNYKVELKLSGKHLLRIDIYANNELVENIEKVVDVSPELIIEDKLAEVNLR